MSEAKTDAKSRPWAVAILAVGLSLSACQRGGGSATAPGAEDIAGGPDTAAQQAAAQLTALGGPANAQTRAAYEGEFQAYGALDAVAAGEGAWELNLFDGYAQFVRPGLDEAGGVTGERAFREHGMQVTAGPLTIALKAEACPLPNGESLPYVANVLFEGVAYQGCARRGAAAGGERPTWASFIGDLLPAIDACLARAQSKPARVTMASALPDDVVSVRMRERDGGRQACVEAADGSRVDAYDSILDTDRLPGEGDPEFVRAASQDAAPPSDQRCRTVSESRSADGLLHGWLVRRSC